MTPVTEIATPAGELPSSLSPDVLLYDQTAGVNENVTSQNFEAAFDSYDNQAADDFVVTAGSGWNVQQVVAPGAYSATHGTPASVRVTFFQDAAGSPGAIVCDFPALSFVEAPVGTFTIAIPGGCVLSAGTKWVSVVANLDFAGGVGGQWFWSTRIAQSGNVAKWQNPGDGFGSGCLTWGTFAGCLGATDLDTTFSLSGVVATCANDADCSDGNLCNGVETCVASACQPGTPVNCDDGEFCTLDTCAPGTGLCSHPANPCSDGDSCTVDTCSGGACQHTSPAPIEFCSSGAISIPGSGTSTPYPSNIVVSGLGTTASLCSVKLNGITHSFPLDIDILLGGPLGGASNAIIMSDVGGTATVSNVNLTLKDSAAASISTATLVSGTFKPTNSGTGDTFAAPAPAPAGGSALSVFDSTNPNGTWKLFVVDDAAGDSGTITSWCVDIVVAGCSIDADCTDGNLCNGVETCSGGTCQPGTAVNCDDGLFCTLDSCVPGTGQCQYVANSCDDLDGCTNDTCDEAGDTCQHQNQCQQFCNNSAIVAADQTTATPYPSTIAVTGMGTNASLVSVQLNGITHTFVDDLDILLAGPQAGNPNAIIFSDVGGGTDLVGVSVTLTDSAATSIPDGGPLVAGTFKPTNVNTGEVTVDTWPAPAPAPLGGSALSVFTGNPNGNWDLYIVDDAAADTGTLQGWCINVRPQGCTLASDCDDANPCTDEQCLAGTCQYSNNTAACNDGDPCTATDVCSNGACTGSGAVSCDDLNVCTDDSCVPLSGCAHNANAAACDDGNACTTGDTCAGSACQPGSPVPPPAEVTGVGYQTNKSTLSWSPALTATHYDVVRGSVAALPVGPGGGDEVCFDDVGGTSLVDVSTPASGSANWYLVRGESACGDGGWGDATGPTPRSTTTCP